MIENYIGLNYFNSKLDSSNNKSIILQEKDTMIYPDDIKGYNSLFEGTKKQITVNAYERNSKARKECINEYGYKCTICKFNFEKVYGEIGKDFIHVHHIKPLS